MMGVCQIVLIVSFVSSAYSQEDYVIPKRKDPMCMRLSDCESLQILIKGTLEQRNELRARNCGFDNLTPMVWCPIQHGSSTTASTVTTTTTTAPPTTAPPTTAPPTTAPPPTTTNTAPPTPTTTTAPPTTTTTADTTTMRTPSKINMVGQCITRYGTYGTCVELINCPKLKDMLVKLTREAVRFVTRSRCYEYKKFMVCCDDKDMGMGIGMKLNTNYGNCSSYETPPEPESKCCGIESPSPNKIIDGNPTNLYQHPWSALIEYKATRPYSCGGTLISNKFVLTAAHCLLGQYMQPLGAESVVLGEYDRSNEGKDCVAADGGGEDCNDGAISIPIAKIKPHENYSPGDLHTTNDIALIKLQEATPYTDFIRPICLPTKDITLNPPINLRFAVVGWGAMDLQKHPSNIKLYSQLHHVDQKECLELYKKAGVSTLWDKGICAGGNNGTNVCNGDSGGSLVYEHENFQEIVGVISFGLTKCGSSVYPSIYTKVYEYIDWIKTNINSIS